MLLTAPLGNNQEYGLVDVDGEIRLDGVNPAETAEGLKVYARRQFAALGGREGHRVQAAIRKTDNDGHTLIMSAAHRGPTQEEQKEACGITMTLMDNAQSHPGPAVVSNFYWKDPKGVEGEWDFYDLRWRDKGRTVKSGYRYDQWKTDSYTQLHAMAKGAGLKFFFGNIWKWGEPVILMPDEEYASRLLTTPLGSDQSRGLVGEDGSLNVEGVPGEELIAGLEAYAKRKFRENGGKDGRRGFGAIVKTDFEKWG